MVELGRRFTSFGYHDGPVPVSWSETQIVKDGVLCHIYKFEDDRSRDLALVRVNAGWKTFRQRVLSGDKTIEGFVEGVGTLTVTNVDGESKTYEFKDGGPAEEVTVSVGEIMQWSANGETDLIFYKICEPSYEEGRFEDLPD
ncbi:MAG TPA: hypothetical protein VMR18_01685 [Candidatus Saccharimonadales bacterium]|nr:hypothetical protein [Candidatus Saccharimonadales bacterium]